MSKLVIVYGKKPSPIADADIAMEISDVAKVAKSRAEPVFLGTSNVLLLFAARVQKKSGCLQGVELEFRHGEDVCTVNEDGLMFPHAVPRRSLFEIYLGELCHAEKGQTII